MAKKSLFVLIPLVACLIENTISQSLGVANGIGCGTNGLAYGNGIANGLTLGNGIANGISLGNGLALNGLSRGNAALNGIGYGNGFANGFGVNGLANYGLANNLAASAANTVGYGDVSLVGELPVGGTTAVTGNVPVIGYVTFEGTVPAGGIVSVASNCGCGCNNQLY